jgi:hypothetical protein
VTFSDGTFNTQNVLTPAQADLGLTPDCMGYCLNNFNCLAVSVPTNLNVTKEAAECVFYAQDTNTCADYTNTQLLQQNAGYNTLYVKGGSCGAPGQSALFVSIAILLVFLVSMGFAVMERKKEFVKLFSLPIMFCFYLGLIAMLTGAAITYYVPVVGSAVMDLSLIFSLSCLAVHFLRMYLVVVLPLEKGRLTVKKQFVAPSFNLMIAALLQVIHVGVVVALIIFQVIDVMDWYTYAVQILYLILIFIGAMKTDQAGRHFRMTITASFMVIVCLLTDMGSTVLLGYKPFFVVLKALFLWGGIFKQLFSERKLSIFSTFAKTSTAQN